MNETEHSHPHTLFHELTSLCKAHLLALAEETALPQKRYVISDKETYAYFKTLAQTEAAKQQRGQKTAQVLPPQEKKELPSTIQNTEAPKPQIKNEMPITPKPSPALVAQIKEKPLAPATTQTTPKTTLKETKTTFAHLPHPFSSFPHVPYEEIKKDIGKIATQLELIETPADDSAAKEKSEAWKKLYPKVALIAFCEASGLIFLQNVHAAIEKRLQPCFFYDMTKESTREVSQNMAALSALSHLTHIIVVHSSEHLVKANEFTGLFAPKDTLAEQEKAAFLPLQYKGGFFSSQFFELLISDDLANDPRQKQELWKALTLTLKPL